MIVRNKQALKALAKATLWVGTVCVFGEGCATTVEPHSNSLSLGDMSWVVYERASRSLVVCWQCCECESLELSTSDCSFTLIETAQDILDCADMHMQKIHWPEGEKCNGLRVVDQNGSKRVESIHTVKKRCTLF